MPTSKRGHVGLVLLVIGLSPFAHGCDGDPETEPDDGGGGDGTGGAGGAHAWEPIDQLVDGQVVTLQGGRSAPFKFVAPDDVRSLSVSVVGEPDKRYWICDWTSEDGFVLVHSGWEELDENDFFCTTCNNRVYQADGVTTAFAPNSSASKVTPGEHTLTICGEDFVYPLDGEVRLHVTAKRGEAEPSSGVLDLNLFFTGAEGWTAETAPTDPVFQSELGQIAEIFAQSGITLGNVSYVDLGEDKTVISQDDLGPVYQSLDPDLPLAVNVLFFEHLEPSFVPFLALSAGVPGPYVRNTQAGGIAMSMREIRQHNGVVSRILAHEVGHFIGLIHATEVIGGGVDPLDDTPVGDESNLMHAQPEGSLLSSEQGRVLRLSPFVRNP
jgi:hypothetical protein